MLGGLYYFISDKPDPTPIKENKNVNKATMFTFLVLQIRIT